MRTSIVDAPLARRVLVSALISLFASGLRAQESRPSPITHALFLALGGDPTSGSGVTSTPFAMSAGVERARTGSRWSLRLGADYRRQSSSSFGTTRLEDFGVNMSARYGRASGILRPYLLGGVGVVNRRTRVRDAVFYVDPEGLLFPPQSYDLSNWRGSLTTGVGTDITLGRFRLFTEARMNLLPVNTFHLSRGVESNKALYFGIKF
jgi:hypothetical protein